MTPALERRTGQSVPTTRVDASARFQCRAYLCTMDGARCRDQHVHAMEFHPLNRDACIDCPAGTARVLLLGAEIQNNGVQMDLLTYAEAADFLGIKLATLYGMVATKRIPHVRLGGRLVRFDRAKLVGWIEAHQVPSADAQRAREDGR